MSTDTVENEQPVDSISSDIAAAIQELESGSSSTEEESHDTGSEETTEAEETSEETLQDEEETSEEGDDQEDGSIQAESTPAIDAPHSWNAKAKELFSELPSEAQQYIAEREKERDTFLNSKAQELSGVKRKFEALDDVLSEHRSKYQMSGLDDAGIIRQQFALTEALSNNPAETISMLANQFGVDLENIGQESEETTDPAMKKIAELEQKIKQNDDSAQQQRVVQLRQHVDKLANEKDANGNPIRPHFEEMKPAIAKLMSSKMATSIADAYDKAVKLTGKDAPAAPSPKVDTVKAEQAKKAKLAKKAAAGVKSTSSKSKANANLSLKDELSSVIGNKRVKF